METTIIELNNLESLGNKLKRILAIFLGLLSLVLIIVMIMTYGGEEIQQEIFNILTLFLMSVIFIYYGIMRSRIHKSCFIKFVDDRIEARWPKFDEEMARYTRGKEITIFYNSLLNPIYEELNVSANEIENIEIKMLEIIIKLNSGRLVFLPLDKYDYKTVKLIKHKLSEFKKHLRGT